MQDFDMAMPQCYLESAPEPNQIMAENPIYASEIYRAHGENLWFEPVPLEMLYTAATQPQVLVSVNGLPAVCPEHNCGYSYIEAGDATVTQTTLNGLSVVIAGTDFEEVQACTSDASDALYAEFAGTECTISSSSDSSIECDLAHAPAAGTHYGKVRGKCGHFDYKSAPTVDVPLVVSGVSPSAGLNKLGGDLLTISGSGFPTETAPVVTFDDGTACNIKSSAPAEIKCITGRFGVDGDYVLTVSVNDKSETFTVSASEHSTYAESISPVSLSPVLTTELTIQLSSEYPNVPALKVSDFAAELNLVSEPTQGHWIFDYELGDFVWIPDETTAWPLYVKSVDSDAKTVTLNFRGSPSGDYRVLLSSETHGRLDTENLSIKTEAYVTGVSPSSGSALGGSLVTITGENFSNDARDNAVMIGDALCLVETSAPQEIVCRIAHRTVTEDFSLYPANAPVSVFLKLGETAKCPSGCTFTFEEPAATVNSFMDTYDSTLMQSVVIVDGSGFGVSETGVKMTVDGVAMTLLSPLTDDTARFAVNEILDSTSNKIELYLHEGLPKGYNTVIEGETLSLSPKVYKVTPNTGSAGGTKITISAAAIGTNTDISTVTV
jgi:hypothetical protein